MPGEREIRASQHEGLVRVYQAYTSAIAGPAVANQKFVPPFKIGRMTWIKPSFTWMAYRSGWATKPGQERILAIDITAEGLDWALRHASLTHFEAETHESEEAWKRDLEGSPVRVQWDPERDIGLRPLGHRAIQVGLSGEAVERYVDEWTQAITDVTNVFKSAHQLVTSREVAAAIDLVPNESIYVPQDAVAKWLGMNHQS